MHGVRVLPVRVLSVRVLPMRMLPTLRAQRQTRPGREAHPGWKVEA